MDQVYMYFFLENISELWIEEHKLAIYLKNVNSLVNKFGMLASPLNHEKYAMH